MIFKMRYKMLLKRIGNLKSVIFSWIKEKKMIEKMKLFIFKSRDLVKNNH